MTKVEYEKCEKLMYKAIKYAKDSDEELKKAMTEEDKTAREISNNRGFEYYGIAQGISETLSVIGFTHKDMKTLYELL